VRPDLPATQYPLSPLARRLVAPFRARLERKIPALVPLVARGGSQRESLNTLFFEVLAMLDSGELPGDEITRVASDFGVERTDVLTALAVYLLNCVLAALDPPV
jgi:hypothetical protein